MCNGLPSLPDRRVHAEDAVPAARTAAKLPLVLEPGHCPRPLLDARRGRQGELFVALTARLRNALS